LRSSPARGNRCERAAPGLTGRRRNDLVFPGYEQDQWVALQDYQNAPWRETISLWAAFNRHLARVMAAIPESVRSRPRASHNLDEIAWRSVPATQPATLDYFMADYVEHLEHHLRQILGVGWEGTVITPAW